jgi:DNA adenine methylase
MSKITKPFLKWVGGKTQIIGKIMDKFPKEINNYHEAFLGGGSVLFALLSLIEKKEIELKGSIYAYDLNEKLINVYNNIKYNKDELWKHLSKLINTYNSIELNSIKNEDNKRKNINPKTEEESLKSKEHYYYYIRNLYNNSSDNITISAMFIFLNKTNFRGVYREGPKGYNVPFGNNKNPTIMTKHTLDNISKLIQNVEFIKSSFEETLSKKFEKNDFLYLDPPYAPENSKSFVGYTKDGFTFENHISLFDKIKIIKDNNIKFIMSNARVDLVLENFNDCNIEDVKAKRAINSKKPGSTTTEVIIYN